MLSSSRSATRRRDSLVILGAAALSAACRPLLRTRGAGAETRTIIANAPPFSARGDGRADDTAPLRRAIEEAVLTNSILALSGRYLLSGPLGSVQIRPKGSLNLHLSGDVEFIVAHTATPFDTLLQVMAETIAGSFIVGGSLTLRLNGRCSSGIVLRQLQAEDHGVVDWRASVRVYDARNTRANESTHNHGILIGGPFDRVKIVEPVVARVSRERVAGESKALAVIGYTGLVLIDRPQLSVVAGPQGALDADLLALFPAETAGDPYLRRSGMAVVTGGRFTDAQGRSIKLQGRAQLENNVYVRTGAVPAITESCEVDAQFDGVSEQGAVYLYRFGIDGRSPLGRNHTLMNMQYLVRDAAAISIVKNATIDSAVPIRNVIVVNLNRQSRDAGLAIDGLALRTVGPSPILSRSVVELDAPKVRNWPGQFNLSMTHVSGSIGAPLFGYTQANTDFRRRIRLRIRDNVNTGHARRISESLSGVDIDLASVTTATNNFGWQMR